MSQKINQAFDIPESTLKTWDKEYRKEFNKRHGLEDPFYTEIEDKQEIRISALKEKELDPYYDPKSSRNSLAEQAKIFEQNPAIDAFMRKKWNLHPTMEYSGKY